MAGSPRGVRLTRLDAVRNLLAAREGVTVAQIASDLGISVRTVHRDLAVLRELGVPVEGERGAGGGLWLESGWSLGRVHLNENEAIGLLLSLTVAERMDSPLLLDDLRSVARKVAAAFAPAQSRRIMALRRRILVGQPASSSTRDSYSTPPRSITEPLMESFAGARLARVEYEAKSGATSVRDVETQVLYYNAPVWYVLGWDRLREAPRLLRIDRMRSVHALDTPFRLRSPDTLLDDVGDSPRAI